MSATTEEPRARPTAAEAPSSWARERLATLKELLDKPLTTYYLIIGCSALLLALGLMMVLSASSIEAMQETGNPFYWFIKQSLSAAVSLPIMWLCTRLPYKFFRWAGYPLMALSIIALVLVLFVGSSELGAQRWIYIGPFTFQPSEPAKLGLALWGADLLARRARAGRIEWRHMLIPLMPGTVILAVMVMLGRDLGTTMVLLMIFLALLWVVGAPVKLFGGILSLAVLAAIIMIRVEPYRMARVGAFLDPWADAQGAGYQAVQGQIAMGSGGWFGLGLGSSRQKWDWLPHGESDFIFAILGEELGLMGTLMVVALFGLLGYAGLRVASRVNDAFIRLVSAAIVAWIAGQGVVNMGAVLGVLPITGIPLPLVSYGGSALLPTLAALGMLLSFAKREPGAREALAARGPGPAVRALSWLGLGGTTRGRDRR
ncbi:putative lipid II flippase FtsW [Nonomuraea glycinis]|uniref:Probable peptidoglycan glycosyltransferase FtsW n=1 Tax=Nonomuraea glycinis TaxID=2047744 RepID=A0A918A6L9_9ACTN|nr:putative lipid II flippase FtsW [Nonomuraea glycinis]MCA2178755.1 putative lipid II flippase FtsW [Nonomuraea glycinis]WSG65078.1 putative lipid II flippase FtsW [Nonomuraea glycinis]GGP07989.1 cell division protein FtsW [Nonomuraea glycinis]